VHNPITCTHGGGAPHPIGGRHFQQGLILPGWSGPNVSPNVLCSPPVVGECVWGCKVLVYIFLMLRKLLIASYHMQRCK
jgi:hypothetical protein